MTELAVEQMAGCDVVGFSACVWNVGISFIDQNGHFIQTPRPERLRDLAHKTTSKYL